MIVEVVTRQIREQRGIKLHAHNAVLIESDGRHFHTDRARTAPRKCGKLRMQPNCVRRSIDQRPQLAGHAVTERTDQSGTLTGCVKRMRDPLTAGSFAIGASDTDHAQSGAWLTINVIGNKSCVSTELLHPKVWHSPRRIPFEVAVVPQHRARAVCNRLRDKTPSVMRLARIGDKRITSPHAAT